MPSILFRIAIAILFLVFCGRTFAETPAGTKPSFVFLLTDDQRWDAMSCMGNPVLRTPEMDRLAAEGMHFTNAFVTTAICAVSRASILTGQYARRHGINDFNTPLTDAQFAKTYPGLLRAAGYRTGFIGKYGLGDPLPTDRFDYWDGFPGQGNYFHEIDGQKKHLTSMQADSAIRFLRACRADQPFCLSISFKAPHAQDADSARPFPPDPALDSIYADATIPVPRTATDEHYNRLPEFIRESHGKTTRGWWFPTPEKFQETTKDYYRLITGVDRAIGAIRAALAELGLDKNTVIILTSDNGFFFCEHGMAGKWLMYEESIRVPMIIVDPRLPVSLRGRRDASMALNIDLAPTMLDYAGVPIPPEVQGLSLRPLVEARPARWREDWFYDHLFAFGGKIPQTEGIRSESWAYTRYLQSDPFYEELFDLTNDPLQERNLATDPAFRPMLEQLRERWKTLRSEAE